MPAPEQFLGSSAGLSPATVVRLTTQWQAGHAAFQDRDLSATDFIPPTPNALQVAECRAAGCQ
ncbi:hypothetical protein GCM10018966_075530 [Streptomyces yanii]